MNWILTIIFQYMQIITKEKSLCIFVFDLTFWFGLTFLKKVLHKLLHYLNVARAFVEQCSKKQENKHVASSDSKYQHINLLVTSGSLIPSLVKCLLFRLDSLITHGNGQSSAFSLSCSLIICWVFTDCACYSFDK